MRTRIYRQAMQGGSSPVLPVQRASVVVVDDHAAMRSTLRALVERGGLDVAAEAADTDVALDVVARVRPAVLLLDLGLAGTMSSLDVIARVLDVSPRTRVLVVTMQDDPAFARAAMRAGAAGYVLKERADDVLARAIAAVAAGGTYLDSGVGAALAALPDDDGAGDRASALTPRETQVLRLIARGHTNGEIAEQLGVSIRTVETHRARIQRKLRRSSRAELVAVALERGLLVE